MYRFSMNYANPLNYANKKKEEPIKIFDKTKTFYVCSFGGCGSTALFHYLSNFGNVEHVHDRFPPQKLAYIGNKNTSEPTYSEWFNKTEVPEAELKNIKVIYIYRNPIDVIYSRYVLSNGEPHIEHLKHIMCMNDGNVRMSDIINSKKDLYGLEHFFNNYATVKEERNYKIYCVKYEMFWDNISLFNKLLGVPDIKSLYPVKNERKKRVPFEKELYSIYLRLMNKMNSLKFIEIY